MGLYKRGQVWHMDFVYKGKRYRKSTETADRRLARRIFDKIKGEVAESKWFERLPGEDKLFTDLMDKYLVEHASLKASARSFRGYAKRLSSFFGSHTLTEITPSLVNEYKIQRRNDGVKPATTNRELATMKKAFNLALKEWQWVKDNPVSNGRNCLCPRHGQAGGHKTVYSLCIKHDDHDDCPQPNNGGQYFSKCFS